MREKLRHFRERFRQNGSFVKALKNMSWLAGERVLMVLVGSGASILVARYLGPDQFGILSYATSYVILFGFLSYLGLNAIVTKALVEQPERKGVILGTTFVLKEAGAVLAYALVALVVWLRGAEWDVQVVVLVAGLSLLFDASSVIDLWFESQVRSRYAVVARSIATVVSAAAKVALIVAGAPVIAFAAVFAAKAAVQAAGLVTMYARSGGSIRRWRIEGRQAKRFMKQGWPLIISSAGSLIYLKADQIMLGEISTLAEVGVYAAAAKISEMTYFLPKIFASSVFPSMVKARAKGTGYEAAVQRHFTTVALLGYAVVVVVLLSAPLVIPLLFGEEYIGAIQVLQVHILAVPAVFMGAMLSRWLVAEDLLIFSLTRHGLGAVANIGMNAVLIPSYGAVGAAVATFVSYTIAAYLSCFTDRRTRKAGMMMTRALLSPVTLPVRALRGALARRTK